MARLLEEHFIQLEASIRFSYIYAENTTEPSNEVFYEINECRQYKAQNDRKKVNAIATM